MQHERKTEIKHRFWRVQQRYDSSVPACIQRQIGELCLPVWTWAGLGTYLCHPTLNIAWYAFWPQVPEVFPEPAARYCIANKAELYYLHPTSHMLLHSVVDEKTLLFRHVQKSIIVELWRNSQKC